MKRLVLVLVCLIVLSGSTFVSRAATSDLDLTAKEKAFIAHHPVIHLAVDPAFVPYEFIDSDGKYKGIAADYVALLSQKTGIKMVVAQNLTWTEAYELAVNKKLDVMPCVAQTPDRAKYFLFSDSYLEFQRVVVVRDTNNTIKNFSDLLNTKVAVQINSSHYSFLKQYSQIEISPYKTVEEGLAAVSDGTENAFVGNLATSSYLIKQGGYTNLKYIIINAKDVQSLHLAVRNDWPELVGILNKGLASITKEEKIEINNRWIGVQNQIDYGPIVITISVILLVLCISVFWVVRLRMEVAKRRIVEEQLKKAKLEAETANQIKSSFLARMSHEIRTPLNAITGMAYLIKKTEINTTQKMYLEKIAQASHNMLGIINDILDFSRIESGKIEIERVTFNLDNVLQEVVNIVSLKIEEQDVRFTVNRAADLPNNYFGDPKRIEQILINLLNNALKFTPDGEVSLAVSSGGNPQEPMNLTFTVSDTGIGMSEDQIGRLFTPFVQADSSINRRFGGTGLGLSIVKSLTELMAGKIEVKSTLGKGSTFIVSLPMEADRSKEAEVDRQRQESYFRDIHALVFEKDPLSAQLTQLYLTSFGISADLADSEYHAIKLLSSTKQEDEKQYNLFLLGYDVLEEGVFEFIDLIRDNGQVDPELKIILMIPLLREDLFAKLDENGIDLGIVKPVIPSVLYNGIQEIFKKETVKTQQSKIHTADIENHVDGTTGQVLVVEDNKTNQFIAKSILELAGFQVLLADNGLEGVTAFAKNEGNLDLILMDLHMPVLNGYEAAAQIREINPTIPIVAMTADAIFGVEEECHNAGIDHYVSKPFEPELFVKTLSEILDKKTKGKNAQGEGKSVLPANGTEENSPAPQGVEPVLDRADGLRRVGDNEELYQMILREYAAENEEAAAQLDDAIDRHDYKEAARIVHKNKSGSGNIGAKQLFAVASHFQQALESGDEITVKRLHKAFAEALSAVLEQVK